MNRCGQAAQLEAVCILMKRGKMAKMTNMGPCTENDYLLSFFTREQKKGEPMPERDKMKEIMLEKWPYKFPFYGRRNASWNIVKISRIEELEQLWMHKSGEWLETHGLWRGSNFIKDIAKTAIETNFFNESKNQNTGQYKNYIQWKKTGLKGQLDGHNKPLLVEEDGHFDIVDGFGRLLPYLSLVYEGIKFYPFKAYFAR